MNSETRRLLSEALKLLWEADHSHSARCAGCGAPQERYITGCNTCTERRLGRAKRRKEAAA